MHFAVKSLSSLMHARDVVSIVFSSLIRLEISCTLHQKRCAKQTMCLDRQRSKKAELHAARCTKTGDSSSFKFELRFL